MAETANISNETGIMLIEFATEMNMKIKRTAFQRKINHKAHGLLQLGKTWIKLTDHVQIGTNHGKIMQDINSKKGAEGDSDYFIIMVLLKLQVTLNTRRKKNGIKRYNIQLVLVEDKKENNRLQIWC